MKLSVTVILWLMFSGWVFSQGKTSFIIAKSEIDDSFLLCAVFDKNVTDEILESVNNKLIKNNRMFLKRTPQEKTIVLDDKVTFHINLEPGELRIKFRKTDNSGGRYDILKNRCRDLEGEIYEVSEKRKPLVNEGTSVMSKN